MTRSNTFKLGLALAMLVFLSGVSNLSGEEVDVKKILQRVKSLVKKGELKEAVEVLETAAAQSDDPTLDVQLAGLHMKTGNPDKGVALLETTVKELKKKAKLTRIEKKALADARKTLDFLQQGKDRLKEITESAVAQWLEFAEEMVLQKDYPSVRAALKLVEAVDPENEMAKKIHAFLDKHDKKKEPETE